MDILPHGDPLIDNDSENDEDNDIGNEDVQLITDENKNSKESCTSGQKRKRKQISTVWKYFEMMPQSEDGKERCKCKKCGQVYLSASRYGTGNLKKHIEKCPRIDTKDIGQYILESASGSMKTRVRKFEQTKFRELLVNAVIRHDLPLSFVDYEGIRAIHSYLEPDVSHISRNTCKSEIKKVHADHSARIALQLKQCPGRICLTSDCWTSIATDGYMSLTAHYIDQNWVLHKRILNFSYLPPPHSGVALAEKIYSLVASWGIEKKLFSITLDNAYSNNSCVEILKNQLNLQNCLIDYGSFFHVRCCAHILNLIVREGFKEIDESIGKVRECVKYVKGSPSRKQKFLECVGHTFLLSKRSLQQDVPTRWNSTYLMLSSALHYKLAFCHLQFSDSNFKHNPSSEEWDRVEKLCRFLKLFYNATNAFSSVRSPTSNLYFPHVFLIQLKLMEEMKGSDPYMKNIAINMNSKFDKYWKEYNPLLAMALVFDPRYKMNFVEFSYKKIYGDDGSLECSLLKSKLFSIFEEYKTNFSSTLRQENSNFKSQVQSNSSKTQKDIETHESSSVFQEFDDIENEDEARHTQKSELDLYLNEPRVDRNANLDVLNYWKVHQYRYPLLANFARDMLTIPISIVASESAFSSGSRVLDQYRSSLSSDLVESLICVKDWTYGEGLVENLNLDDIVEDVMKVDINREIYVNESVNSNVDSKIPNIIR